MLIAPVLLDDPFKLLTVAMLLGFLTIETESFLYQNHLEANVISKQL
jgi:hypothetical protein